MQKHMMNTLMMKVPEKGSIVHEIATLNAYVRQGYFEGMSQHAIQLQLAKAFDWAKPEFDHYVQQVMKSQGSYRNFTAEAWNELSLFNPIVDPKAITLENHKSGLLDELFDIAQSVRVTKLMGQYSPKQIEA